jgi:hypothetical protein
MMAPTIPAALTRLPAPQPPIPTPLPPPMPSDPLPLARGAGPRGDLRSERPGLAAAAAAERFQLRLQSSGWGALAALAAGLTALALALARTDAGAGALEAGLRSAGCGFFYGLLAFHLQRVDPDDGHLQAGLVGALCGIRSLSAAAPEATLAPSLMMECARIWLPLWLPLIGSALLVHGFQRLLAARHRSTLTAPGP